MVQPPTEARFTVLEATAGGGSSESMLPTLGMGVQKALLTTALKLTAPLAEQAPPTVQFNTLPLMLQPLPPVQLPGT